MESPARSEAVLELGKRLVAQLELGDDLLAQWMAHDIAARITAVEQAGSNAPTSMRDECTKSILALWEYRNELPLHLRAFRELEPLVRTLVALDVDKGDDYRYFRTALRDAALDHADAATKEWLELAFGLDYSARVLIQYALRSASANAASKAKSWVEVALSAEVDPVAERHVVEFVLGNSRSADDAKDKLQEGLRDKIAKLESFAQLASTMAAELRDQLESALSVENDGSGPSAGSS
jgi:hypothetical protein